MTHRWAMATEEPFVAVVKMRKNGVLGMAALLATDNSGDIMGVRVSTQGHQDGEGHGERRST